LRQGEVSNATFFSNTSLNFFIHSLYVVTYQSIYNAIDTFIATRFLCLDVHVHKSISSAMVLFIFHVPQAISSKVHQVNQKSHGVISNVFISLFSKATIVVSPVSVTSSSLSSPLTI
jgi:hypothetical protein